MTLANDIARCHDAACPQRQHCLRWLDRDTGNDQTPHVATLRIYTICQGQIKPEPPA